MKKITFDEVIAIFAVVLMALTLILSLIHFNQRMEDGTTVTTECKVIDKYYKLLSKGGKSYYVVLLFENEQNVFEETIDISKQSFYDSVKIGDMILCEVTYDEEGIIDLEVTDSTVEEFSTGKRRNGLLIGLGVFVGLFAVTMAFTFFMDRKGN